MRYTDELPKRNNAYDGRKAHNDNQYYMVGRIPYNSWANEVLPAADIIIDERELVHIANEHSKELSTLGMSAFLFVQCIMQNFNEIRYDAQNNSYFLIVKIAPFDNKTAMNCAVIELEEMWFDYEKVYIIKTAHPTPWGRLLKLRLLCVKPRS